WQLDCNAKNIGVMASLGSSIRRHYSSVREQCRSRTKQAKKVNMSTSSQQEFHDQLTANDSLTRLSMWVSARNLPFLVTSIGMIVMLLWAGAFKMTAPGAEGIAPLV